MGHRIDDPSLYIPVEKCWVDYPQGSHGIAGRLGFKGEQVGCVYLRRWNVKTGELEFEFVPDEGGLQRAGLRGRDSVGPTEATEERT